MTLAGRVFLSTSLLVAAAVGGLIIAADRLLRRNLEADIASGLEHEARLVATLLPVDSAAWPDEARRLGALVGHRVTLIDSQGRVRGDTEFDRDALPQLENHAGRPEVREALVAGIGRDERLSASTNERRMYVAVQGGPQGIAVVRLSTKLDQVDRTVTGIQRTVAAAGFATFAVAALLAWALSGAITRHVVQLGKAARAIATGETPAFPDSRIPEIAEHVQALHLMHQQLVQRFAQLRREREETHTLIESMADGLLATDAAGNIATVNTAARRLLSRRKSESLPPVTELFHDKPARDLVRAALEGREVEQRELELEGRALLVTSRPLPNGGALLVFPTSPSCAGSKPCGAISSPTCRTSSRLPSRRLPDTRRHLPRRSATRPRRGNSPTPFSATPVVCKASWTIFWTSPASSRGDGDRCVAWSMWPRSRRRRGLRSAIAHAENDISDAAVSTPSS